MSGSFRYLYPYKGDIASLLTNKVKPFELKQGSHRRARANRAWAPVVKPLVLNPF
jgi:hypothetical protein